MFLPLIELFSFDLRVLSLPIAWSRRCHSEGQWSALAVSCCTVLDLVTDDNDLGGRHASAISINAAYRLMMYTTWRATHPAWSLPVDPYLSPILTHRGERTSILMCKRPGCRPTEVRARVPPPADGSGPATVRGRSEPQLGMHRGACEVSFFAPILPIGYWHGKGYRLGNLPAGLARAEGPGCSSESESIKSMTIDALLWTDSRARLLRCTRVPPLSASGLQDPYLLLSYKDTQSFARQMTA